MEAAPKGNHRGKRGKRRLCLTTYQKRIQRGQEGKVVGVENDKGRTLGGGGGGTGNVHSVEVKSSFRSVNFLGLRKAPRGGVWEMTPLPGQTRLYTWRRSGCDPFRKNPRGKDLSQRATTFSPRGLHGEKKTQARPKEKKKVGHPVKVLRTERKGSPARPGA